MIEKDRNREREKLYYTSVSSVRELKVQYWPDPSESELEPVGKFAPRLQFRIFAVPMVEPLIRSWFQPGHCVHCSWGKFYPRSRFCCSFQGKVLNLCQFQSVCCCNKCWVNQSVTGAGHRTRNHRLRTNRRTGNSPNHLPVSSHGVVPLLKESRWQLDEPLLEGWKIEQCSNLWPCRVVTNWCWRLIN